MRQVIPANHVDDFSRTTNFTFYSGSPPPPLIKDANRHCLRCFAAVYFTAILFEYPHNAAFIPTNHDDPEWIADNSLLLVGVDFFPYLSII